MLAVAFAIWSVLIWPVVMRFHLSVGSDFLPQGFASLHSIGMALRLEWKVVRDENGLDICLRFAGKEGKAHPVKTYRNQGMRIRKAIVQDHILRKT